MKVLLFGADGNMGRRYRAILKHLGHECIPIEVGFSWINFKGLIPAVDKVIIASSTEAHWQNLLELKDADENRPGGLDVLCEKPVVKDVGQLNRLRELCESAHINLYVVNQYQHLVNDLMLGGDAPLNVEYDYWNSGRDGILWDCFQLVALATGGISLKNESPYWKCQINGCRLGIQRMDFAYVDMISDFLHEKNDVWGIDVIEKTTRKILEMQNA